MSFGWITFILVLLIGIEILFMYVFHRMDEIDEYVADRKFKTDKEIYELRRRVAILEKAQEREVTEND